jgi:hypothetical protein
MAPEAIVPCSDGEPAGRLLEMTRMQSRLVKGDPAMSAPLGPHEILAARARALARRLDADATTTFTVNMVALTLGR